MRESREIRAKRRTPPRRRRTLPAAGSRVTIQPDDSWTTRRVRGSGRGETRSPGCAGQDGTTTWLVSICWKSPASMTRARECAKIDSLAWRAPRDALACGDGFANRAAHQALHAPQHSVQRRGPDDCSSSRLLASQWRWWWWWWYRRRQFRFRHVAIVLCDIGQ